jgi:CDP-diacylglycerol--serine O-phosphatidyltransferase
MIRKHVPNFITCLNILCGSFAVILALKGLLTIAVIFIIAASIFDFLDGVAARLLKAYSPMGKELDSLADMISFGLAPGLLMFVMLQYSLFGTNVQADNLLDLSVGEISLLTVSLLIPVFSGLRLAKFNIDERQTDSFIGLPTPANALFISSLALITEHGIYENLDSLILQPIVLLIITIITSFLLVSELPMFSLKFKNLTWKDNHIRFIFLALSFIFILAFNIYGIAAAILSFILISILLKMGNYEKKI